VTVVLDEVTLRGVSPGTYHTIGSRLLVVSGVDTGPVMGRSSAETVQSHHDKRKETDRT